MKKIELILPAIVFLDGNDGKTDSLKGRDVLLHVRSASVVEVLEDGRCGIKSGVPTLKFTYTDKFGAVEHFIIVAHYIAADADCDNITLNQKVLKECADFYIRYCENEDRNIREDELSKYN